MGIRGFFPDNRGTLSNKLGELGLFFMARSKNSGSKANLNFATHSWDLRVWDTKLNTAAAPGDKSDSRSRSNFVLYSSAQANGVLARREASAKILNALRNLLKR